MGAAAPLRPGLPANLTAEGQALIAMASALRKDALAAYERSAVRAENMYEDQQSIRAWRKSSKLEPRM
jgi:hypothetical protein